MMPFVNMFPVDLMNGPALKTLNQMHSANALANRIGAIVTENGRSVSLAGSCVGTVILADHTTVPLTGSISGNQAYVELTSGCYTVEGPIHVFVTLETGESAITLVAASGYVRATETGTVIDPGTIIPSVAQLIEDIEDARASIPADYTALIASIATDFSDNENYDAGDYVWYNGTLYRFNVLHAAGAWSGAQVESVAISNEITAIRENVPGVFYPLKQYYPGDYVWHNGLLYMATKPNYGSWRSGVNFELANIADGLRHTIGGNSALCLFGSEKTENRFAYYDIGEALENYVGETITLSFDLKASTSREILVYAYQNAGYSIKDQASFTPSASEFSRFSFITQVKNYGSGDVSHSGAVGFYDAAGDNMISVKNFKIELGSVATPWQMSAQDAYAEMLNTFAASVATVAEAKAYLGIE